MVSSSLDATTGGSNVSSPDLDFDPGPLPSSDGNAELQRESIKALNAFLKGQDDIILRDERVEGLRG